MPTNLAIDDKLIEEARLIGLHRTKKQLLQKRSLSTSKGANRLKLLTCLVR